MEPAPGFRDDGPEPWFLLFPLVRAAVVVGAVWLLRRTVRRGRPRHFRHRFPGHETPVDLLGKRFAAGEIEADEYRARLAVLSGTDPGGGREDVPWPTGAVQACAAQG
ncbi:SHOCT domain-containing protein [Streptomyces sp. NBC_01803]|uniref:SHOCT domain-containing protein n=1 Tax=Streptomyces sp. NBC_01803 TaxID=2975946 RepID=UPI002DDBA514|nr:SHOCT domain-containing protein [Streptomyces sp. NBC_01803]WSA47219.1 SHOCT domain-containing protein [Streptomyces sp. NBC_01803]